MPPAKTIANAKASCSTVNTKNLRLHADRTTASTRLAREMWGVGNTLPPVRLSHCDEQLPVSSRIAGLVAVKPLFKGQ